MDPVGDGARKVLWAQAFAENGFFKQGDATRMTLNNGRLVNEGRVRVPSTFRATGATFSNITGKGTRALAFIDEFNRLRIAVDNEDAFRSATQVGSGMSKLGVERQVERGGRVYIYYPEPMPLSVDLDGDGIEEIIVPQNQLPGRLAVVYKGPGGYRFQTVNSGFEGTVVAIGAIPGEGNPALIVAVTKYTNFLNTQGAVMSAYLGSPAALGTHGHQTGFDFSVLEKSTPVSFVPPQGAGAPLPDAQAAQPQVTPQPVAKVPGASIPTPREPLRRRKIDHPESCRGNVREAG